MLNASHPSTRFHVDRRALGKTHEHGLQVEWVDGPSTESVAALVSGGDFTRADLRRGMSDERASLLQMLIWSWHGGQDVKPTQQEFTDAYRRWFVLGVEEFPCELTELNITMRAQATAAGVHPHTWYHQHGSAALRDLDAAWPHRTRVTRQDP